MKRVVCFALAGLFSVCALAQSGKEAKASKKSAGFIEDFAKAKQEAVAFKQPIFALFTGSDWCPWCIKLHDEVLGTKVFAAFAADNLVLFKADFPQTKKQSDDLRKQNEALAKTYQVDGYPTVLLLDAEGKQLGQTGYELGGAEAYVKNVKALMKKAGLKVSEKTAAKAVATDEKK